MEGWLGAVVVLSSVCLFMLFFVIIVTRLYMSKKRRSASIEPSASSSIGILQGEMSRMRQVSPSFDFRIEIGSTRRGISSNYYVIKRSSSSKSLFLWDDRPSLIHEVFENGWRGFGFVGGKKFASTGSRYAGNENSNELETEFSWEPCAGSSDIMQKIRFKSAQKRPMPFVITTALPLPGPAFTFPSEAYFEITVLSCPGKAYDVPSEGEKTKLIQEKVAKELTNVRNTIMEDAKNGGRESVVMSLGLSGGAFSHSRLPGRYPGSVGFDSNGSVFLDGNEVACHSEQLEWGRANKVIGCGFDPKQKKVYFTVAGELVYSLCGKSEEFGAPLYPTMGARKEVEVLVNLGQMPFRYAQANSQRIATPLLKSPATIGYDDSKELFSIGRIDSLWLNRCSTRTTFVSPAADFDETDADLFDIVFDADGGHVFSLTH